MATQLTNQYKYDLLKGNIDFSGDDFYIALMGSSYVYDPKAHNYWDLISSSELTAFGEGDYIAGGQQLSGVTVGRDDASNKAVVTWSNASWTPTAADLGPIAGAIIYQDTGNASTSIVIGYLDFGSAKLCLQNGTFTIGTPKVENL